MTIIARAPGKLVILGEYAVLAGGTALVMAVDRYAVASIDASTSADCVLETFADAADRATFAAGADSGVAIVDLVTARWPARTARPWTACLDSRDLFADGAKLGLGSSAAALCAWSGAWRVFNGADLPAAADLVALHRESQGGGSGLDVAASRCGGVISYALDGSDGPRIGSAGLPDSVGFVAVSTRRPASTPAFLRGFDAWRAAEPRISARVLGRLREIAAAGAMAAAADAVDDFLAAIVQYAAALEELGHAMGADIMTAEHRAIAAVAARCGLAYKVSGAGGGDVGLAFAASQADLDAFRATLPRSARALALGIAHEGLTIEGHVA